MVVLTNKEHYFSLIQSFERIPYTQSETWFRFTGCEESKRVLFLVDCGQHPTIACFAHIKTKLGLQMLLIEGECLKTKNYSISQIRSFYESITQLGYPIVETCSTIEYKPEYEIAIREAGYLRPVGLFSIHLTNLINLQIPIWYDGNWKKNLKKASKQAMQFCPIEHPTTTDIHQFYRMYKAHGAAKKMGHSLTTTQIARLTNTEKPTLFVVKNEINQWICGIIIHRQTQVAGSLFAAKTAEAQKCAATYFMYDQLFAHLKEQQIEAFDMEKILPSTHSTQGVFKFKNGPKGELITYAGEWAWYKNRFYRILMYFVKRFVFKKREV